MKGRRLHRPSWPMGMAHSCLGKGEQTTPSWEAGHSHALESSLRWDFLS